VHAANHRTNSEASGRGNNEKNPTLVIFVSLNSRTTGLVSNACGPDLPKLRDGHPRTYRLESPPPYLLQTCHGGTSQAGLAGPSLSAAAESAVTRELARSQDWRCRCFRITDWFESVVRSQESETQARLGTEHRRRGECWRWKLPSKVFVCCYTSQVCQRGAARFRRLQHWSVWVERPSQHRGLRQPLFRL
jgi:hypothetical protein